MIELGKVQNLKMLKRTDFGVYLGESEEDKVLLPKKQVPDDMNTGDEVKVFVYRDSEDRLISTIREPKLTVGSIAVLKVNEVIEIGAFLDWGLEKDLLLPFKEQTERVMKGNSYLVALYIDKSNRLAATMKVYDYLKIGSEYEKDDEVEGIIYEIKDEFGAFLAVDNIYYGLIPTNEIHEKIYVGQKLNCRVTMVREDGKLNLSMRKKAYLQMDADADIVYNVIVQYDGILPYTDKAEPDLIEADFGMSKNAFKRAVGRLLKEDRIEIINKSEIRIK